MTGKKKNQRERLALHREEAYYKKCKNHGRHKGWRMDERISAVISPKTNQASHQNQPMNESQQSIKWKNEAASSKYAQTVGYYYCG